MLTPEEIVPLARAVYSREKGGVGCCLHIALDDGNLDDCDILFCLSHAVVKGRFECISCAAAMMLLSDEDRTTLYDMYREYA